MISLAFFGVLKFLKLFEGFSFVLVTKEKNNR